MGRIQKQVSIILGDFKGLKLALARHICGMSDECQDQDGMKRKKIANNTINLLLFNFQQNYLPCEAPIFNISSFF